MTGSSVANIMDSWKMDYEKLHPNNEVKFIANLQCKNWLYCIVKSKCDNNRYGNISYTIRTKYMKHCKRFSTSVFSIIMLLSLLLMVSCTPQTKESYLEKYKEFISDVSQNYKTYTEKDWEESLEQYERFSIEWYAMYADSFTWKEQVLVEKYEFQYKLMKAKVSSVNFFNIYLKEDYEKLKEDVKYYYENDMEDDIEFLLEQAKEIGDSAVSIIIDIIEELDIDIDLTDL